MVRGYTVPALVSVIVTIGVKMLVEMAMRDAISSVLLMSMFQKERTLVVNGGTMMVVVVDDDVPRVTVDT
jgi:hypothetical protein